MPIVSQPVLSVQLRPNAMYEEGPQRQSNGAGAARWTSETMGNRVCPPRMAGYQGLRKATKSREGRRGWVVRIETSGCRGVWGPEAGTRALGTTRYDRIRKRYEGRWLREVEGLKCTKPNSSDFLVLKKRKLQWY